MQLTPSQLQTIKAWVQNNNASRFDESSVALLNATAAPDYYIFKERVDLHLVMANGFDWTVVDNETVGQARIFDRMLALNTAEKAAGRVGISPWKLTVLRGIGECWKGNTPTTQRDHRRNLFYNHFPRKCRVWEKLFVVAAEDWNVASNADKTGSRGANTNPDVMPMDAAGDYLAGLITLDVVIASESE